MKNVLFAATPQRWAQYREPLARAFAESGAEVHLATDIPSGEVDYIVYAPNSGLNDFRPFRRAKAVLNLWAGVEDVVGNPTLDIPLARMIDDGLTRGMVEYVTGHVLRYHLGSDRYVCGPVSGWERHVPPLAFERPVGILGLGALGAACAGALSGLGFDVAGWSRRPKCVPEITCLAGAEALATILRRSEIVVLLVPLTADTENLLDASRLRLLPRGACVINPGRGALIDDAALIAALDGGHVAHATLDVFREEPLPEAHPFRSHPRITVTPHIAAETRPVTAARVIAENVRRGEAGEPFLHLVDRSAGY